MSEQLTNALAQLAAQLGTTVPYLWDVMVRGVTLRAAADMVGYSLFALVLAKVAMWLCTYKVEDEDGSVTLRVCGFLLAFSALFPTFGALASATDLAVAIVSPEYVALEKLMRLAR